VTGDDWRAAFLVTEADPVGKTVPRLVFSEFFLERCPLALAGAPCRIRVVRRLAAV
jgi:hypothetical protein